MSGRTSSGMMSGKHAPKTGQRGRPSNSNNSDRRATSVTATSSRPNHSIATPAHSSTTHSTDSSSSASSSKAPSVVSATPKLNSTNNATTKGRRSHAALSATPAPSTAAAATSLATAATDVKAEQQTETVPIRADNARMTKLHESVSKMLQKVEFDVINSLSQSSSSHPQLLQGLRAAHIWSRKSVALEIEKIAQESGMVNKLDELDELAASQPIIGGKRIRVMSVSESKEATNIYARTHKQRMIDQLRAQAEELENEVRVGEERDRALQAEIREIHHALHQHTAETQRAVDILKDALRVQPALPGTTSTSSLL